jgi:hypothetical protein
MREGRKGKKDTKLTEDEEQFWVFQDIRENIWLIQDEKKVFAEHEASKNKEAAKEKGKHIKS